MRQMQKVIAENSSAIKKVNSKLGGKTSKHMRSVRQAYESHNGFTRTGDVYTGAHRAAHGTVAAIVNTPTFFAGDGADKTAKSEAAKSVVAEIIHSAKGSSDKAEDIIRAVLQHKFIRSLASESGIAMTSSKVKEAETEHAILEERIMSIERS